METLKKVIDTLGRIEVHGKDNLDMLLGCILALEQLNIQSVKKEESENGEQEN